MLIAEQCELQVSGAAQELLVTDSLFGDRVMWTSRSTCSYYGTANTEKTHDFFLSGSLQEAVQLNVDAGPGTSRMCFTPINGIRTYIPDGGLLVIPRPTFKPAIGIAGSVTRILFVGSTEVSDIVVLQEGNCLEAQDTQFGIASAPAQNITSSMQVKTHPIMNKVPILS